MNHFDDIVRELYNHVHVDTSHCLSEFIHSHKVVIFGVGKSFLAAKLSASLANSFGLKWYAVDAMTALHGDIGIVSPTDLIVLVSNSGETTEVLTISEILHNHTRIVMTRNCLSKLAQTADHCIHLPVRNEFSPFGYAPMFSSLLTVLFLNDIIVDIVNAKGLTEEAYTQNHPSGAIGELVRNKNDAWKVTARSNREQNELLPFNMQEARGGVEKDDDITLPSVRQRKRQKKKKTQTGELAFDICEGKSEIKGDTI